MKTKRSFVLKWMLAISMLQFAVPSSRAQSANILMYPFNTSDQVDNNNGNPWDNWYGTAFYSVTWDSSDASNNATSGSMRIISTFPDSGIGGCCGPQFVVRDQNDGVSGNNGGVPLNGYGSLVTNFVVTNITFDVRFDPNSTDTNPDGTYPGISVFTRGLDFGQHSFGSIEGVQSSNTNWIHMSFAIGPNDNWAQIPDIGFSHYSATENGALTFYVDNIAFQLGTVAVAPPTMAIQKPARSLRIFAGSSVNTYDREELTTINTNQSWVGGTYPVSYSFTLLSFPSVPSGSEFRFHVFLVPVKYAGNHSFTGNEFIEYQASNNLWLHINAAQTNVWANVQWKTNRPNDNPNVTVLQITNSTAVGTWTLTFNSATTGTLTAPGKSPAAFTIPADVAAQFANPLVAFFGVQPDSGFGEGQYVDIARIQTTNIASPGFAVNDDFTTDDVINTNVWDISNSAQQSSVMLVTTNAAYWVSWTFPDFGYGLGTRADLGSVSIPWKTPYYYASYNTNFVPTKMGGKRWSLIDNLSLPTVNGLSNGVPSTKAFFRLSNPSPAE